MPDLVVECKKLFRGATLEEVYHAVLDWVQKMGANVTKADRPELLTIACGRSKGRCGSDSGAILRRITS